MKLLFASLAAASLLATPAFAGDAAAGKAKAAVCAACHGAEGKASIATYPHLAGQNAEYLKLAMKAYKNGQRKGAQASIMTPMMAPLSDEDIDNLAAYYASLHR
ncbi:MAG: c-type cytochrome [Gammaproteobacteria bacterium]|nr:c-type cytochrome [Gammaproteobacteria bacterium]